MPFSFGLYVCFSMLSDLEKDVGDETFVGYGITHADTALIMNAAKKALARIRNTDRSAVLWFARPRTRSGASCRHYKALAGHLDGVVMGGDLCFLVVPSIPEKAARDSLSLERWATKKAQERLSSKKGGDEWKQTRLTP